MFAKSQKFAQIRHSDLSSSINRSRFIGGDGDDSIDNARSLGRLSKGSSLADSGHVSEDDPDYYKFTLKNSGSIKFNFQNRGDESVQFSIVNSRDRVLSVNGNRLFADVGDGDKSKLDARLAQGTYYIRVETEEGNSERFSLKLKFGSRNDD